MSNYESRHPDDMVLHPLSEIREWDEALAVLGIQDSDQTPAEAVRELNAEIERLSAKCKQTSERIATMTNPRVTDDDAGEITVALDGRELRGWSYKDDAERRVKMGHAREYVEGWCDAASYCSPQEGATPHE